jgi:hypothetical protein
VAYRQSAYGQDFGCHAPVTLLDQLLHFYVQTTKKQLIGILMEIMADIQIGFAQSRTSITRLRVSLLNLND